MTRFKDVEEALCYEGADRVVHFTDYLLEKASKANIGKTYLSGWPKFDKALQGIQTGEVVVVSGYLKNGKTLFAESWLRQIHQQYPDVKSLFFSFEVQTERIVAKYMDNTDLQVHVPLELKTMDFDWLWNRCYEAKTKHGASIIVIDHLHFLVDMATKQNMSLNIGAFMRKLKMEIANGLDLAVILIAHQGQPKEDREASVGGIRDSSFIGQECDSVILVGRRKNLDPIELQDVANTHGDEVRDKVATPHSYGIDKDDYSSGLAVVRIAAARRSGAYEHKRLFKKTGNWLMEV